MIAQTAAGAVAAEIAAAFTSGEALAPFSGRRAEFGVRAAYAAAAALRRLRVARGERPVGRKIGFTNRTIWPDYGVSTPIWGDMYASTVFDLAAVVGGFSLAGLAAPQIEPEIVFKLSGAPRPDMDEVALMACVGAVAHGFELVQSPYPAWRFKAEDCIAAGGLHGALICGPFHAVGAAERCAWAERLPRFRLELLRNGELIDEGAGANVLDGPVTALRHLVALLRDDPDNPPLAAGEIVTTGTLTRAFPVRPGERWETRIEGLPLAGIAATFR